MPNEGFLHSFHALVEPEEDTRVTAALSIRQGLNVSNSGEGTDGRIGEDLKYTLQRLVRGVQSSRQCCRQGFSLALAEVLMEHPSKLSTVMQLIKQHTGQHAGLKNSEQKDRFLGRLFALAAILEAGCLSEATDNLVVEWASWLEEIYSARPYLRAPAATLFAKGFRRMCDTKLSSVLPEVLAKWSLEAKAVQGGNVADAVAAGLLLELRLAYEEVKGRGVAADTLKTWPACIRTDMFSQPNNLESMLRAFGGALITSQPGDATPFSMGLFCEWWLKASKTRDPVALQDSVWPALDEALFEEKATPAAQAQGLRALADLASGLKSAGVGGGAPHAEALLVNLFEKMPQGVKLLLKSVSYPKSPAHKAALLAQRRLIAIVDATPQAPQGKKRKHGELPSPAHLWQLGDATRLSVLAALQKQAAFSGIKGKFRQQWQRALLSPLSPSGVRACCCGALANLPTSRSSDAASSAAGRAIERLAIDQLAQLACHSRAPDEVILAVLCFFFTVAFFVQEPATIELSGYSIRSFSKAFDLHPTAEGDDLFVPVLAPVAHAAEDDDDDAEKSTSENRNVQWRAKLWATLGGLMRRTSPDAADKILAARGDEEGGTKAASIRSYGTHGCMSDGSLWILRLHEWWDHVTKTVPQPSGGKRADTSPAPGKKKARSEGRSLRCLVDLGEEGKVLRERAINLCRNLLAEPQTDGALSTRQRNAIAALLLTMALALLQDPEEQGVLREKLEEALGVLERLPPPPASTDGDKQRNKASRKRAEILASLPLLAAELFSDSSVLVREAARTAWRELGAVTSDETLTTLCGSVKEDEAQGNREEDDEDDDEGEDDAEDETDGPESNAQAARAAKFAEATQALKAARESADTGQGDGDDASDEEEDIPLGSDELWDHLLGDGDDPSAGPSSSLLAAFAGSGLEHVNTGEKKLTKRQRRLRQKQEEIIRKFRELELLDIFLQRFAEQRQVTVQILRDLYECLIIVSRRSAGPPDDAGGGGKKRSKGSLALRRVEGDLARRISEVIAKSLKQLCPWAALQNACQWHTAEEWASFAKAACELGGGRQAILPNARSTSAGGVLVYWFCALHRAKVLGPLAQDKTLGDSEDSKDCKHQQGWALATELLSGVLLDWSTKRASEQWCEQVLVAFATRVPALMLTLPWCDQIRCSRNAFVQRSLVVFVDTWILRRPIPSSSELSKFRTAFAEVCVELLESTTDGAENGSATSAKQRHRLRHAVLRALSAVIRKGLGKSLSKNVAAVVKKVIDELQSKRGDMYQQAWKVLRTARASFGDKGQASEGAGSEAEGEADVSHRKRTSNEEGSKAESEPKRRRKEQTTKGSRTFFADA